MWPCPIGARARTGRTMTSPDGLASRADLECEWSANPARTNSGLSRRRYVSRRSSARSITFKETRTPGTMARLCRDGRCQLRPVWRSVRLAQDRTRTAPAAGCTADQRVALLQELADDVSWHAPVERDGIPVALVHVVPGHHARVLLAQELGEVR